MSTRPAAATVGADERSSPRAGLPRLRILYVGNPGSIHVRRWAGSFAARGHDVHVAGLWEPTAADAEAPFPIHRLGRATAAAVGLNRLAHRLRPDVVHAHYLTHYGWITWGAFVRPYALTLWGSDILIDARASRLRRAWARLTLAGAALVTADAPDVIAAAIRLGAIPARTREIQFGVDTKRFRPGSAPAELAASLGVAGRRVVFAPRSIAPLYRTDVILEAVAAGPRDVILIATLAGADPESVEQVRRSAAALGMSDRLVLVPAIPHDEIDAFYRLADVVVSVPASDGTPVSLLEAFATGTPMVATDLPSVRPWLEAVRPDLLVKVGDVAGTARAIQLALDLPPADRAKLAAEERDIAVARADQAGQMDIVEADYHALAGR